MKKVYLLLSLASCFAAGAQTFEWAKAEGKNAYDYGYGIDCDNQGNVYVAGKYEEDQADFSGIKVTCEGNHDGFLCKYGADGSIKWVRTYGGTGGDYSQALYCDKTNYVYVAGEIEANTAPNLVIKFSGSTTTVVAKNDNDIVVAKYDLEGNLIWAKAEGASNSEKALGVAADKDGNVLICGYYDESTVISGTTYSGKKGRNIFVAKFDKDGNFLWFRDAGSDKRDEAKAVKCDSDGNVYLCGIFNDNCQFGSNTLYTYHNTDYWDAFVAKYDPSGNLLWVKTGGGDVTDGAWSMTVDNGKNVYISGEYSAYADFGGGHQMLAKGPLADTYVAKYNTNGDLQWIKGNGSDKDDRARGLGTDGTHIFITGQFGGTAQFGGASITSVDTSDVYVAALDDNGAYLWAVSVGGKKDAFESLGYESGNAVNGFANGPNGAVYATGGLLDDGVFGNTTVGTSGTRTNAFVTKISWNTGMPPLPDPTGINVYTNSNMISVYPNPSNGNFEMDLSQVKDQNVQISVFNHVGQLVSTSTTSAPSYPRLDVSSQPEGIYLVEVRGENSVLYRNKLIVKH